MSKLVFEYFSELEIKNIVQQLSEFPNNQYTRRLKRIFPSQNITLHDFWLLLKDCLVAAKYDNFPPFISFGRIPDLKDFRFARECGLIFTAENKQVSIDPETEEQHLKSVYCLEQRRRMQTAIIDPALTRKMGSEFSTYTCKAQQEAVRTTLLSPASSTLVINLPTGCGKTLVTHAVVMFAPANMFTIVVVPTIGLAIEQSERMKSALKQAQEPLVPHYCWHSGLTDVEKHGIKNQILSGKQRVLFVSPESVTKGLLPTLFKSVSLRLLANIVVDEAHLIDSWGAAFRPDFQRIGALVSSLRAVSSIEFKTILMSATFSDLNIKTIKSLFCGDDESPIILNGSFLRQEMAVTKTKITNDKHTNKLMERIFKLPKPLIVYATRREDCYQISENLSALGLSRHRLFTGDTSVNDRKEVLQLWANNEVDIIIATSAFGVGMDKNDVRSILHTSIPENIDRYYQEIGRSGRDGIVSECEIVFTDRHLRDAESLNRSAIISIEKGLNRWKSLWEKRIEIDGDGVHQQFMVDLSLQPEHVNKQSDENTKWNWLTLLLMQRSELIRLSYAEPEILADTDEEGYRNYWEQYSKSITVTILNEHHMEFEIWESVVERQRKFELSFQNRGLTCLKEWLFDSKPLCKQLNKYYTLDNRRPTLACGGCPECRSKGKSHSKAIVGYMVSVSGMQVSKESNLLPVYFKGSEPEFIANLTHCFSRLVSTGKVNALSVSESSLKLILNKLPSGFQKMN
jgi:ATP-dependent DNA helicase RecQ